MIGVDKAMSKPLKGGHPLVLGFHIWGDVWSKGDSCPPKPYMLLESVVNSTCVHWVSRAQQSMRWGQNM